VRIFVAAVLLALVSPASADDFLKPFVKMAVRPLWDPTCKLPAGTVVFAPPLLPSGQRDPAHPVARVVDELRSLVGTWYGGLIRAGDAKENPFSWVGGLCVGLYDDVDKHGRPDPNAFATDDRQIVVGRHALARAAAPGGFAGGEPAALLYTLAHEFGHHLQFQNGLTFRYEPTVRPRELQADCIAGYLLALTRATRPAQAAFVDRVYAEARAIGDNFVMHPQHHGTSAEREAAVSRGWLMGSAAFVTNAINGRKSAASASSREAIRACSAYPSDQQRAGTFR
jgi:hypothetical protein